MRVIPVIDMRGGRVVRAAGGRRETYRPVESRLTSSFDPVTVARQLVNLSGAKQLYCADLDAIVRATSDYSVALQISDSLDVDLYLDAGLRTAHQIDSFPIAERLMPVIASESLDTPEDAGAAQVYEGRVAFSVDLRDGDLIGPWENWSEYEVTNPRAVAEMAWAGYALTGARTLFLIDVGKVGSARGVWAESLCREIKERIGKRAELVVGGGVRNWDDIRRLEEAGADGVLVATAIHDGTLTFPRPES